MTSPDRKYFNAIMELEKRRTQMNTMTAVCPNCLKAIIVEYHICKKEKP